MHNILSELVIINRIPTLRKLTEAALVRLGWENILEFSNIDEGRSYLEVNCENSILLLELNLNQYQEEFKLIHSFKNKLPLIVTLQNSNKEVESTLKELGVKDVVFKTFDISEYSHNLTQILQNYVSAVTTP